MTTIHVINSNSSSNGYILESGGQSLILELGCRMMDYVEHLNTEGLISVRGCIASHW